MTLSKDNLGFVKEQSRVLNIKGTGEHKTKRVQVAESQSLQPGSVLGKITANGQYKLAASASTDGSQVADAILYEEEEVITASGEEKYVDVIVFGNVQKPSLVFGTGKTIANSEDELRLRGIYLQDASEVSDDNDGSYTVN